MKKNIYLLLSILISKTLFAQLCTNDNRFTNVPYFTDSQISAQFNITYGNALDWNGVNTPLKLDVYYPTLAIDPLALRPLILMVHGGGLISGDKNNYSKVCSEFAKRGFVAVSINYRLGVDCFSDSISDEKAKYRAQQDVKAAFRFVTQNASILRVDTSWMFIGGGSAGSVAALSTIYLSQAEWNIFTPGIESLLGNLNTSGNNLTNTYSVKGIFNDWGAMLKESMQSSEMLPTVSFHGDADSTVLVDSSFGGGCLHLEKSYGSRAMHQLLIANGICSDLSVKIGGDHGVYQDSIFGVPFRVGRAACFFKSLFCNDCANFYQTDSIGASCSIPSAINNINNHNNYTIYPNPFSAYINISGINENEIYTLIDIFGKTHFIGRNIQNINLSYLQNGFYYLKIDNYNSSSIIKLVKQ